MSGSLRRFEKSTKNTYFIKKPGVRVRQPPAVQKIKKKTHILLKKPGVRVRQPPAVRKIQKIRILFKNDVGQLILMLTVLC